jgi:transcriptional regulator GlxA family with amidase domain
MKSDQEFVDSLVRVVNQNYANPNFDVISMAAEMKISDRQLQRKVKALTGQSPVQHLREFRLEESLQHLRQGVAVGKAAKAVGFSSHAYFSCCFKVRFGTTPGRLRTD